MRLAAERNQIVVVAYWSALNEDCVRMEERVFKHQDVVRTLRNTVAVKLPALTNQRFADDYGLMIVPSFVIFGSDGQVLRVAQGYMDEARFRGMVEAARLRM
jgi:thiol:disulfide interchange protein